MLELIIKVCDSTLSDFSLVIKERGHWNKAAKILCYHIIRITDHDSHNSQMISRNVDFPVVFHDPMMIGITIGGLISRIIFNGRTYIYNLPMDMSSSLAWHFACVKQFFLGSMYLETFMGIRTEMIRFRLTN